jgi:large subunit ribosomal protein LP0
MSLNTGLIFTSGDLSEIKSILDSQVREAPARIGSLAPADVTIPAGPTGLDPKQTSFFQALNIQTKIVKSQVEIVTNVKVISQDEKISAGQAALLDKLKIRPFEYKMHIKSFLDNGKIYDPKVLSITPASVLAIFAASARNVTALSLGSGYIVSCAAPHLVVNAFKNLAAVSFASDYSFPQAEKLKSAAASRPAASGAQATAVVAPVKEAEPEPEEDVDMGDLFGGDY